MGVYFLLILNLTRFLYRANLPKFTQYSFYFDYWAALSFIKAKILTRRYLQWRKRWMPLNTIQWGAKGR